MNSNEPLGLADVPPSEHLREFCKNMVKIQTLKVLHTKMIQSKGIFSTTKELAKYLEPFKITKSTLDKWVMQTKRKQNNLPFHKKGKTLYFYRSEIDEWLKSQH
jgi:excisionase family DNA binding protein